MDLFSELYSCYYQVVASILKKASGSPLSRQEIAGMVLERAFSESGLAILPKLLDGDWNLMEALDGRYISKISNIPTLPLSTLQKSWIRAILRDSRARLFLDDQALNSLESALQDVPPLFSSSSFHCPDADSDGDPYSDPAYRKHFQKLLGAVKNKSSVHIVYCPPNGRESEGDYLPCYMEYSSKNDKFRVYACRIQNPGAQSHPPQIHILNIGRILDITDSQLAIHGFSIDDNMSRFFAARRCQEPVRFRIFQERNALERCMLHFASYEKCTSYEEGTNTYLCSIWYDTQDETELLIRILSFGPVLQVLGPAPFLRQVRQRILRQHQLLNGDAHPDSTGS